VRTLGPAWRRSSARPMGWTRLHEGIGGTGRRRLIKGQGGVANHAVWVLRADNGCAAIEETSGVAYCLDQSGADARCGSRRSQRRCCWVPAALSAETRDFERNGGCLIFQPSPRKAWRCAPYDAVGAVLTLSL